MLKSLWQWGVPVNQTDSIGDTVLAVFAERGDLAVVRAALARGAEPTLPSLYGPDSVDVAIRHNHADIVQAFLEHELPIDHRNHLGEPMLVAAARHGSLETLSRLLSFGADPAWTDRDGHDALWMAVACGHSLLSSFLLDWISLDDSLRSAQVGRLAGEWILDLWRERQAVAAGMRCIARMMGGAG